VAAPKDLWATPGNAQIFLQWNPPVGIIEGYNVYRSTSNDGTYSKIATTMMPTYLDLGLRNGLTYWYKVSATNNSVESPLSEMIGATPFTTPDAPKLVSAIPGVNCTTLVWSTPINDGGSPLTGYLVLFGSNEPTSYYQDILMPNTLSIKVTGLTAGMQYSFAIKAQNAAGFSGLSNVIVATLMNIPGTPTELVSTTSFDKVTIIWTVPSGPITGYHIFRGPSVEDLTWIGDSLSSIFNDTAVEAGSSYFYKVSAYNEVGDGNYSSSISVLLPWPPIVPVAGIIVNNEGKGLIGVTVALENGSSVQTDIQGMFTIYASQGNHTLTVSGAGIQSRTLNIEVNGPDLRIGAINTIEAPDSLEKIVSTVSITAIVITAIIILYLIKKKK